MADDTSISHPGGSKRIDNASEHTDETEKKSGQADVGEADAEALEKAEEAERGSGGAQAAGQR